MGLRRKNLGQSTMEFTILLILIMAAFLTISMYFKRGVQGRWKAAVDDLGDQYDPRTANTNFRHSIVSNTLTRIESVNAAGGTYTSREDTSTSVETKTGYEGVETY